MRRELFSDLFFPISMIPIPTSFFPFFSTHFFVIIVGNALVILDVFVFALAVRHDGHRFLAFAAATIAEPVLATVVDRSASCAVSSPSCRNGYLPRCCPRCCLDSLPASFSSRFIARKTSWTSGRIINIFTSRTIRLG